MCFIQPGEVPGAWLWKADWTVFQPPVHPGGGMNVGECPASAPTGWAMARTAAPVITAKRIVRCTVAPPEIHVVFEKNPKHLFDDPQVAFLDDTLGCSG